MVGRVLRPYPGKENALILDHAGNLLRHGLPEDEIHWTLDADGRAENASKKAREKAKAKGETIMCPACKPREVPLVMGCCPVCDWRPRRRAEAVPFEDGDLARLGAGRKIEPRQWTHADKDRFFGELLWIAKERGYKRGWAAHKFRERMGHWPPVGNTPPREPTRETLSWVRSRMIAWAKARRVA